MMSSRRRSGFLVVPLVVLLSLVVACSAATEPPDTLDIVRLTVGTQTVHFDQSGLRDCCDGAGNATLNTRITIASGGTAASRTHHTTATFHRADGKSIELDPAVHEVRLSPESTRVTFTRLTPFTGNLFRANAGITGVTLMVVHTVTGEILFGPHQFSICTTAATAPATGCAS
jgi:hypothetical protein